MSTTGHETEAINVQGLKASLQKLKTESLDPNVNKGVVNEATCSTAAGTAAKTVTAPASFSLTSGAAILVKFTNGISVDNATLAVGSTAAKPIYYKGAALEADYVEAGDIIMLKYDGTNYNVVGKLGGRALPEVQIGGTAPTSESEIKLFVDEDSDDTVEVYTKAQANILYAGKTDKVSGATNGNFAGLDTNGNLVDSGKNANSFQLKVTDGASIGSGYGICETAATTAAKEATLANYLLLKNIPVSIFFENGVNVAAATLNINTQGAKPIFIGGSALQPGVIRPRTTVTFVYDGTNYNIISIGGLEQSGSDSDLWVDMGLPSGTLWAKANIDVTTQSGFAEVDGKPSPFKYECSFFSWGNTDGHNPISNSAFDYNWGTANDGPYADTPGAALTGNISPSFDAARANLGAPWRMPTTGEFAELFNNIDYIDADGNVIDAATTNKLITMNSIVGIRLKSKINNAILFFPCSGDGYGTSWNYRGSFGFYWSSSLDSATNGRGLNFYSGGVYPQNSLDRFYGFAVRPVM